MTNHIRAIAEVSIPEGRIDEFKGLVAEIIDKHYPCTFTGSIANRAQI